ncbi:M1 family peptidase, partial [Xanthomonas sp. Kuri4-2]
MPRLFRFLSPCLLALCGGSALAQPAAEAVPTGRLPDWAVPQRYALDLKIDPEQQEFSGRVTVEIDLRRRADHLWLHGKQLKVSRATLATAGGETLAVGYAEADPR